MSFTQEKMININPKQVQAYVSPGDRCDGCDFECKLGYMYSSYGYYIYPTINGEIVSRYINENYKSQFTGVVVHKTGTDMQKLYAKTWAGEIARLCDHYKIR